MLSVDGDHVRFAVVMAATAVRPAGAVGGVLSLLSFVLTLTALLGDEILPAASMAFTVKT
ncbi:hypothetical protein D3C81_1184490 [compost metagenome]